MNPRSRRAMLFVLLVPFAVSCAPWLWLAVFFILPSNPNSTDAEGAGYVLLFSGALSFIGTGPLTGLMLSLLMRTERVTFLKFAGLFWLVALPVLSFECVVPGTSFLPIYLTNERWSEKFMNVDMIYSSVEAVAWYAVCLAVLYPLARRGVVATAVGFAVLVVTSLVFVGWHIAHS